MRRAIKLRARARRVFESKATLSSCGRSSSRHAPLSPSRSVRRGAQNNSSSVDLERAGAAPVDGAELSSRGAATTARATRWTAASSARATARWGGLWSGCAAGGEGSKSRSHAVATAQRSRAVFGIFTHIPELPFLSLKQLLFFLLLIFLNVSLSATTSLKFLRG